MLGLGFRFGIGGVTSAVAFFGDVDNCRMVHKAVNTRWACSESRFASLLGINFLKRFVSFVPGSCLGAVFCGLNCWFLLVSPDFGGNPPVFKQIAVVN